MIRRDIDIRPFAEGTAPPGLVSFGIQSYGYDLRLGRRFKLFRLPVTGGAALIDPCRFDPSCAEDHEGDYLVIPPGGFALAESVEYMRLPHDVTALVVDKSSVRRCGILMGATVGEAGWEGRWTLELTNATPLPARLRAGMGIAQVLFFRGEAPPSLDYGQKGGRYQGQQGLTLPSVR